MDVSIHRSPNYCTGHFYAQVLKIKFLAQTPQKPVNLEKVKVSFSVVVFVH